MPKDGWLGYVLKVNDHMICSEKHLILHLISGKLENGSHTNHIDKEEENEKDKDRDDYRVGSQSEKRSKYQPNN